MSKQRICGKKIKLVIHSFLRVASCNTKPWPGQTKANNESSSLCFVWCIKPQLRITCGIAYIKNEQELSSSWHLNEKGNACKLHNEITCALFLFFYRCSS